MDHEWTQTGFVATDPNRYHMCYADWFCRPRMDHAWTETMTMDFHTPQICGDEFFRNIILFSLFLERERGAPATGLPSLFFISFLAGFLVFSFFFHSFFRKSTFLEISKLGKVD